MENSKTSAFSNGLIWFGAAFSASTKIDADAVTHKTLKAICDAVSIPVVIIGGICTHNILEVAGTGIDGVALVSAIFAQDDIYVESLVEMRDYL